ncbi:MAG: PIN domain-containing protein [Treponema sp.]|nr:PIN domain-containing protein [Treponema sp.]
MTILLDTNIILDYIAERPFSKSETKQIFEMIFSRKINGIIAAHSITNLWYILRKTCTAPERREIINTLLECFEIAEINKTIIQNAINRNNFSDFEDCLQDECAKTYKADYIITRDKDDFTTSLIPTLFPTEFLNNFV